MNNNNSLFNYICNMFNNLSSVTNSSVIHTYKYTYILKYYKINIYASRNSMTN